MSNVHEHAPPLAWISGAGSGIGRAIAMLLSESGMACALVGRRVEALDQTGRALAAPSVSIAADLERSDEVARSLDAACAWLTQRWGGVPRLHALINNAGWSPAATIDQTIPSDLDRIFALNALAPARAIRHAWGALCAARGVIVSISSIATLDPFPTLWAYAGAKASVNLLTHAAHAQGVPSGVRAFAVAPGAVETDLLRGIVSESVLPTRDTLSPAQVARVVRACVMGEHDTLGGRTLYLSRQQGLFLMESQVRQITPPEGIN